MVEVYKREGTCLVDLGSDQTSCHVPFNGGYYPVGMSVQQSQQLMHTDHAYFKKLVQKTWVGHILIILDFPITILTIYSTSLSLFCYSSEIRRTYKKI